MPLMYTDKGFLKAAAKGKLDLVEKYLAKPGFWLKLKDENAYTALHLAIEGGHSDIARTLIDAGAKLEEKNRHGWTPLYQAALRGHETIITALLAAGADVKALSGTDSVLNAAVYGRRPAIVDVLLAAGADPKVGTLVTTALRYGQGAIALKLVEAGADISSADQYGSTPLSAAVQQGDARVVQALLDKGVDVNTRDNTGYTPLHLAAMKNHAVIAEMLLAQGANPELKSNNGETAYRLAKDHRNEAVEELLQDKKKTVDPAAESAESWTRLGDARIAYVGLWPAIERKITEIFNFESRERVTITENLRTGIEHVSPPAGFDTLGENTLRRALSEFNARGGKMDEDSVLQGFGTSTRTFKSPAQPVKTPAQPVR